MSYHSDVEFDVWRSGRNPDAVNYDRVEDMRYNGYSAEDAAASECRRMRQAEEDRRYAREREEEEYCRQCQYEEEARREYEESAGEQQPTEQGVPETQNTMELPF